MLCCLSPSSCFQPDPFSGQWPGLAQGGLCLKQLCEISRTFYPPMSVVLELPSVILQPISSQLCSAAAVPERPGQLAFQAFSSPRAWRGEMPRRQGQRSLQKRGNEDVFLRHSGKKWGQHGTNLEERLGEQRAEGPMQVPDTSSYVTSVTAVTSLLTASYVI